MQLKYKALLISIICIHAAFGLARLGTSGIVHQRLVRLHVICMTSTAMLLTSFYIWVRVTLTIQTHCPNSNQGNRRLQILCLQDIAKAALLLFLFLCHIALFFYYIFIGTEPNFLAFTCLSLIAAYAHIVFFLIIADLILFSSKVIHQKVVHNTVYLYLHDNRTYHIFLAVILGFMFMLGGLYATQTPPSVRRSTVPLESFHGSQDVNIALLSDIHIGPSVGRNRIAQIVEMTNALNPDVIAIAGDLADGLVKDYQGAAEPLCNLSAPGGVYFATGNHEYMHGNVTEWFWFLENCNITILHNSNKHVEIKNQKFCIAGADDLYAAKAKIPGHGMDMKKTLTNCNADSTNILLAHQPNAAKIVVRDESLSKKVDLILSGHTHGGQMYPFAPFVYLANSFTRGQYYDKKSDTYVYVSAGVNFFGPPIKMFGSCEIIQLSIVPRH